MRVLREVENLAASELNGLLERQLAELPSGNSPGNGCRAARVDPSMNSKRICSTAEFDRIHTETLALCRYLNRGVRLLGRIDREIDRDLFAGVGLLWDGNGFQVKSRISATGKRDCVNGNVQPLEFCYSPRRASFVLIPVTDQYQPRNMAARNSR